MYAGRVNRMHGFHSGQYRGNYIARQLVNELAKRRILLRRSADDGERPYGALAMIDTLDPQHWKLVREAVIAQVIAEGTFRLLGGARIDAADNAKIGFSINGQLARAANERNAITGKRAGERQFAH